MDADSLKILVGALGAVATTAVGGLVWLLKRRANGVSDGRAEDRVGVELAAILRPLPEILTKLTEHNLQQTIYARQRDERIGEILRQLTQASDGVRQALEEIRQARGEVGTIRAKGCAHMADQT